MTVEAQGEATPIRKVAKKTAQKSGGTGRATTRRDHAGRVKRFDWQAISKEYIEGQITTDVNGDEDTYYPTQKELAEKHGCAAITLAERCSAERWVERRKQYQLQVVRERQAKRARTLAKNAVAFDEKSYKVGEIGMQLVTQRLAEIAQEVAAQKPFRDMALANKQAGHVVDKKDLYSAVNYRELEGLAASAERFQGIGMKALGTDVQRHEVTGADGEALGMTQNIVNISTEIIRDDTERTASVIQALADAGMFPQNLIDALMQEDEAVEGEVVETALEPQEVPGQG